MSTKLRTDQARAEWAGLATHRAGPPASRPRPGHHPAGCGGRWQESIEDLIDDLGERPSITPLRSNHLVGVHAPRSPRQRIPRAPLLLMAQAACNSTPPCAEEIAKASPLRRRRRRGRYAAAADQGGGHARGGRAARPHPLRHQHRAPRRPHLRQLLLQAGPGGLSGSIEGAPSIRAAGHREPWAQSSDAARQWG